MTRLPKNIVASILARLRNVATEAGLSFNDILQAYVIERFLARLARSPHADTVLLKGASRMGRATCSADHGYRLAASWNCGSGRSHTTRLNSARQSTILRMA